jgi:hypothetical protein
MAKFAMARNAIAVIRFMTVSPFHEASTFDRLQFVKRRPEAKRDRISKLFQGTAGAKGGIARRRQDPETVAAIR